MHEVQEDPIMFTGNTIDELTGLVETAEARAQSDDIRREYLTYSAPAFNVYGIEQFKKFEREMSLMGVA